MDVHAFLLSDMLLLCKVLTKKSHSSNPEARMKVIRQPLIVDRLLVSEINKDNQSIGLALVYLNEYNVVSTFPQCGNFMIFPSLRFYVKSGLENLDVLKLPFLPF